MKHYKHLLKNELIRIGRDNMLIMLAIYPFVIALFGRYGVPYLQRFLMTKDFDLSPHYPVIVTFLILVNPYIFGALASFTILDEQEDRVLEAIQITPIHMLEYLTTKISMIMVISVVTGIIIVPATGLVQIAFGKLLLVNLLMALAAPFNMLLINSIANNKIEGFAVTKGTGFLLMMPLVAFYAPQKYTWFFSVTPAYWPAYAMATAIDPTYGLMPYWMYALVGFLYVFLLSALLYRRFENRLV